MRQFWWGIVLSAAAAWAAPPAARETIDGKIVEFVPAAEKVLGIKIEAGPIKELLAIATTDGRLLPILPSDAGRMFYEDPSVRQRPMRLETLLHPATPMRQVVRVFSLIDGKPNEIYYWCEICSIRFEWKRDCDCCQGPVELRQHPVGERYSPTK